MGIRDEPDHEGSDDPERSCVWGFPNPEAVPRVSEISDLWLTEDLQVPSDWIALNVLRSVALSTNSVAASVEPVMQQQFFSLSPMAGQESFGPTGHVLAHTPTTSSMLAALQQDAFSAGAGLDHNSASQFGGDAYSSMGGFIDNMDTAGSSSVVVDDGAAASLFGDYSSSGFDAFGPGDLSAITAATPEVGATEESGVKVEPAP